MTIKDQIWLLAHSKEPEDRREWAVLYWKSQGLTHRQVADKLAHGKDWVQRYMTSVYKRFEAPEDYDRDEKWEWLVENVFPALKEFIEGNPDFIKELPPPPPGGLEKLEDTQPTKAITKKEPKPIIISSERQSNYWRVIILLIVVVGIISAVGYLAYNLGRTSAPVSAPFPPITAITAVTQVITEVMPQVPIPSIVSSSLPTIVPSDTPLPTETPAPTPEFYNQGEWATLKDGVFIRLISDFTSNGGACMPPNPGFSVGFEINNTTGNQFLLRYDSSAFHAQDDLGNQYKLLGVGTNSCNDAPGVQQFINPTHIFMKLAGQSPLDAHYLIITADSLSGVKLVFHKLF